VDSSVSGRADGEAAR